MLRCLEQEYGTCGRGQVIYNGLDAAPIASASKQPFVLSAGRLWDPAKNIAQLAAAARDLAWPVYVAGDTVGPEGHGGFALPGLRRLGLLPRQELAGWMERAAIFALPARYEPFGLSILEAAAARCALVLGDIPSLRELWAGAALFVDPRDPAALHGTLAELTQDSARCAQLGSLARERSRRYAAPAMARRYADLYRSSCRAAEAMHSGLDGEPRSFTLASAPSFHLDPELTP
jgi:glycogen synthase